MTFVIYQGQPPEFPATDQNPNAVRYQVGNVWVDSDAGQAPTQSQIDAILTPSPSVVDAATLLAAISQPGTPQRAAFLTLFNHENRIRTLESKAPITQAQFLTAVQAVIR